MLYTVKTIQNTTGKEPKNPLHMVFFVIKKKVYKKAVDRNRVKRRARKAFLDAVKSIKIDQSSLDNFFKTKRIIFFLERDMIQEVYSVVVDKMKTDILQIVQKNTLI